MPGCGARALGFRPNSAPAASADVRAGPQRVPLPGSRGRSCLRCAGRGPRLGRCGALNRPRGTPGTGTAESRSLNVARPRAGWTRGARDARSISGGLRLPLTARRPRRRDGRRGRRRRSPVRQPCGGRPSAFRVARRWRRSRPLQQLRRRRLQPVIPGQFRAVGSYYRAIPAGAGRDVARLLEARPAFVSARQQHRKGHGPAVRAPSASHGASALAAAAASWWLLTPSGRPLVSPASRTPTAEMTQRTMM